MDLWHILETVASTAFVAGVTWGAIKGQLAVLSSRITTAQAEATRANARIDTHLQESHR